MTPPRTWPRRLLRGFARFWWDFLIGDTPELFVATLAIVGVAFLVSVVAHWNIVAVVLVPILVVAALGLSLARARRAARR